MAKLSFGKMYLELRESSEMIEVNRLCKEGWELVSTHTLEYDRLMGKNPVSYARQSTIIYVMGKIAPKPLIKGEVEDA
jgi:hypothetical protein